MSVPQSISVLYEDGLVIGCYPDAQTDAAIKTADARNAHFTRIKKPHTYVVAKYVLQEVVHETKATTENQSGSDSHQG